MKHGVGRIRGCYQSKFPPEGPDETIGLEPPSIMTRKMCFVLQFVLRKTFTGVVFHVHLVASGKLLEISTLRDMTKAHLTLGGLLREEKQTSKKFN